MQVLVAGVLPSRFHQCLCFFLFYLESLQLWKSALLWANSGWITRHLVLAAQTRWQVSSSGSYVTSIICIDISTHCLMFSQEEMDFAVSFSSSFFLLPACASHFHYSQDISYEHKKFGQFSKTRSSYRVSFLHSEKKEIYVFFQQVTRYKDYLTFVQSRLEVFLQHRYIM